MRCADARCTMKPNEEQMLVAGPGGVGRGGGFSGVVVVASKEMHIVHSSTQSG